MRIAIPLFENMSTILNIGSSENMTGIRNHVSRCSTYWPVAKPGTARKWHGCVANFER
jgi:hypothetical protein